VWSAYKLALQTEMEGSWHDGSSRVPDGSRPMYKKLWNSEAPPRYEFLDGD
jgi:hypothetical protein